MNRKEGILNYTDHCGQMIFAKVLKLSSEERIVSSKINRQATYRIKEVSANFVSE